ncbi:MAG: hypothetical protein K5871_10955 [Lachnospiraceae bacterium]|nr:hypothetical protein [Lachnospiraceae bacterium]
MIKERSDNFISNNKGETIIEIMVSFMLLLIALAMFTGAITFAGSSSSNSIDMRRATDNDYTNVRTLVEEEDSVITIMPGDNSTGAAKVTTLTDTDGNPVLLTAYRYDSGSTVYWIYR